MNARIVLAVGLGLLLIAAARYEPPANGGQEPAPSPALSAASGGVAVIDVARVFRENRQFNQQLAAIRAELDKVRQTVAVRQVEIESVQRKLAGLRPGTPEYEPTQLLLTRLQTELKLFAEREQQELLKQESVLYTETYSQMSAAVKQYAEAQGLKLVLRSSDLVLNPDDRKSVLAAINQLVVYQQGLDITEPIIRALNATNERRPA